jgi:predicted DNA-binding transcriptional regulator AlpA
MITGAAKDDRTGERLWNVNDLSAFLGVPVRTLYQWRYLRYGPPGYRLGRHVRYDPTAVRTWLKEQDAQGGRAPHGR